MNATFHHALKNAIELHCHSEPSIFPRKQNDWELLDDIKAAGMDGVVIKSHESQTADRSGLLRMKEPGLHVYGGLVCNYATGGLSPYTVDAAIRLGAKTIWMPTLSAQEHYDHFALKKTKLFASEKPIAQPTKGLRIWNARQQILPEVHDILQLIAEADIILATGHLSPAEVLALADAAREHGVRKLLIQHADMGIAKIPLDMQQVLARRGAFIEKCYLACTEDFNDLSVNTMANTIREIGVESCVLVTDHGQPHNLPPVAALSQFVSDLISCGISESEIKQMIVTNPHILLGLS